MSGDEEHPESQDAIERRLTPLVLKSFAQIARLATDFEAVRLRRLEAILRNEEVPEETESASEEFHRAFAVLMESIYLNGLRIDQLTMQVRDLAKRLAQGDVEAVAAEAHMSPDEIQRLAADIAEGKPEVTPTDTGTEASSRALASLTPREEYVLRMRFGIDFKTDHTLEEVGRQFSVTRERIRRIEAKALRRMKEKAGLASPPSTKPADLASRKNGHVRAKRVDADAGKRIESGRTKAIAAIYESPLTMDAIVLWRECLLQGVMRLRDVIDLDAAYSAYKRRGDGNGQDDEGSDDGR